MRRCKPTDGLYEPGHVECVKCEKRQICALVAIYYGKVKTEDAEEGIVAFTQTAISSAAKHSRRRRKKKRDDNSRAK
jgi:hypothetical protein